jgi:hypothetical protein
MSVIQDLLYFDLKITNDEVITVLQREALKCLKSLLLNLRPLMDLKNVYRRLLLLSEMTALHPTSIAKYLTMKPSL